ncbi:MAG: YfjI family protein [Porticoccaceae bacterium]|nr:YfjI family protein [Porticoccaceae bacterium]
MNSHDITLHLQTLFDPGDIFEIRALAATTRDDTAPHVRAGVFARPSSADGWRTITDAIETLVGYSGVYVTLNPLDPARNTVSHRLARSGRANRSAGDIDVLRRRWLFLDVDPDRPSGAATDEERARAAALADVTRARLEDLGWPEPVEVDSGNGRYLLYRVDLPAMDDGAVRDVLDGIARTCTGDGAHIDTAVANPSRIIRVAGTLNRKGDGEEPRPWRMAEMIAIPDGGARVVSDALLQEMALRAHAVEERSAPREIVRRDGYYATLDQHIDYRAVLESAGWRRLPGTRKSGARTNEDWVRPGKRENTRSATWDGTTFYVFSSNAAPLEPGRGYRVYSLYVQLAHNNDEFAAAAALRKMLGAERPIEVDLSPFLASLEADTVSPVVLGETGSTDDGGWAEPRPIGGTTQSVPQVTADMLPGELWDWCHDESWRMQAPVDYIAVSALVALGSLVGRQAFSKPKMRDTGWLLRSNMWGLLVGDAGAKKSPMMEAVQPILARYEEEHLREWESEMRDWRRACAVQEAAEKQIQRALERATTHEERERIAAQMRPEIEEPVRRRYYTNSATFEGLHQLVLGNPNGILLLRDEMVGLLVETEREGRQAIRTFLLEGWSREGMFTIDTVSGGARTAERVCISLLGCATPQGISTYTRAAAGSGRGNDGLMQRFGLIAYPDARDAYEEVDAMPDSAARARAMQVFDRCRSVDTAALCATRDERGVDYVSYTPQASQAFQRWLAANERKIRTEPTQAIQSHLAKLPQTICAIALITHIARSGRGAVPYDAWRVAERWAEYSESHARRLYDSALEPPSTLAAKTLLARISAGDVPAIFVLRDVYRRCWAGMRTRDEAAEAVAVLTERGYLRPVEHATAVSGRVTQRWAVHPRYTR